MLTVKVVNVVEPTLSRNGYVKLSCNHSYQPYGDERVGADYECCNCHSPNYKAENFILAALEEIDADYDMAIQDRIFANDLLNNILSRIAWPNRFDHNA